MARAGGSAIGNLPQEIASFIGRRREVADVRSLLRAARLVTLVGVGGVGKTRLALRVAAESRRAFRHGVWQVELGHLDDGALLAQTVAAALRVPDLIDRSPAEALVDQLGDRQLLLVLDNCEHLVEAASKLCSQVLHACPRIHVLATSRERLGVDGEIVFPVRPLSTPDPDTSPPLAELVRYDAVSLLLDRADAVARGFTLTEENRDAFVEICRQTDGLPLAIELAAARLPALSPQEIRDRIADRFALLTRGLRNAPPRHQTLAACIDWSYDLCTPSERRLWACLSVFAGTFDLDDVAAVCADDDLGAEYLPDVMGSLLDKSIVVREEDAPGVRFRLLESIRAYGLRRLGEAGGELVPRRRHRDRYRDLVEGVERDWFGPHQVDWLNRLRRRHSDIRAALEFSLSTPGEGGSGVRLAGALWPYWVAGGFVREGRNWLDRALAVDTTASPERARALWANGLIVGLQGQPDRARALLAECHEILQRHGDDAMWAPAARVSGLVEMLSGESTSAMAWFERSIRHLAAAGKPDSQSVLSYADLGLIHGLAGNVEHAIALCERARAECDRYGERWSLSWILPVLTFVRLARDDPPDVTADLTNLLRIKRSFNDVFGVLQAAEMLAWVAAAHGDAVRAVRLTAATKALWKPLGSYLLGFQPYLDRHDTCESRARAALDEDAYRDNARRGARFDLEHLVRYALGEGGNGRPEPPRPAAALPGGLTPREREVAELIAQGLSNQQIATRLSITRRTAESHVEHILAKLGCTSRGQAAARIIASGGGRDGDA